MEMGDNGRNDECSRMSLSFFDGLGLAVVTGSLPLFFQGPEFPSSTRAFIEIKKFQQTQGSLS